MMKTGKMFFYCISGSILEWYDFTIFGMLTPILATVLFPHQNHLSSILFMFAIFTTAFFMRPIGGVILGHIGDKHGRRYAIITSVFLMTIASLGIALLPTSHTFSYFIIALFILFRLLQGFAFGGEFSSFIVFAGEISKPKHFYVFQSLVVSSTFAGALLGMFAAGITTGLFHKGYAFAWRLPFMLTVLLGLIGFYLRRKASETASFKHLAQENKIHAYPITACFKFFNRDVFKFLICSIPVAITPYYAFIYFPTHLIQLGMKPQSAIHIGIVGLLLTICLSLIWGRFAKNQLVLPSMKITMLGFLIVPILGSLAIHKLSLSFALPTEIAYAILISMSMLIVQPTLALLFPAHIRCSALALCMNIAAIFGGATPFIAQYLFTKTHLSYSTSFYLPFMALIAIISLAILNNKNLKTYHSLSDDFS